MTDIKIKISKKIAICKKKYLISSNSDYTVTFEFDDEWNPQESKTARFIFDEKCVDVPFLGNSVSVPKIPFCKTLGIGVFSDTASSTVADLGCIASVRDFEKATDAKKWGESA